MSVKNPKRAKDDSNWSARLRNMEIKWLLVNPEMRSLKEKLLSLGGDFVVLRDEPDLDKLLDRGQTFSSTKIILHEMAVNNCHSNVAELFRSSSNRERIVTGWALNDDGLWRQHSWLVTQNGDIIETTESRLMYYGVEFTEEESNCFCFRENAFLT